LARIDVTVGRVVSKRSTIAGGIDASWPAAPAGIGVAVSSGLGLVYSRFAAGVGTFPYPQNAHRPMVVDIILPQLGQERISCLHAGHAL
jgi:hypothetical protein